MSPRVGIWLLLMALALGLTSFALYKAALAARTGVAPGAQVQAPPQAPAQARVPGLSAAERLRALDPEELAEARARGEALWGRWSCVGCHQPGTRSMRRHYPLDDLAARHDVDSLAAFLQSPTPPMPVFPLDEQARRDLAIWLLAQEL